MLRSLSGKQLIVIFFVKDNHFVRNVLYMHTHARARTHTRMRNVKLYSRMIWTTKIPERKLRQWNSF